MPSYITLPLTLGIKNVAEPDVTSAVTTKGYVDARISSASATAPTSPVTGTLWVDTSTYVLKVYSDNLWRTVSGGVASTSPTINSGSLSGPLTSTSGTASPPVTFSVAGTNLTAGILVTAPQYFEVSLTSGGTYSNPITVGAAGTIAATTVYVRLTASAPINTYNSQNIVLTSAAATTANVTTAATGNSVTAVSTTPTITGGAISGALTTTFGTASSSASFTVSGVNMTTGITVTPPTSFEVSLTSGGTYLAAVTVTGTGTISSTTVYVRLKSTAAVGNYNAQNIALTSASAALVNVTTLSSGNSVNSVATTSDFTYTSTASAVTITGYTGTGGAITIPSTIGSLPVTNIASQAFYGNTNFTNVTIPASVTTIGSQAFGVCSNLVALIVDGSNPNYSSTNGVLFNKNQTSLIQYPGGKTGIYTILNTITSITEYAFYNCSNLTGVTIPSSVTAIGAFGFSGCSGLTALTIPSLITSINYWAFSYCTGLQTLTIPNTVTSILDNAFVGCTGLTNVTVSSNLTSLGASVFNSCSLLTSVSFLGNAPTVSGSWSNMTGTVYHLSAATGWGTTFAGRPVAISDTTIVDRGYTTPTSNGADYYMANATDYYLQPN